jgi:hypothetical protein
LIDARKAAEKAGAPKQVKPWQSAEAKAARARQLALFRARMRGSKGGFVSLQGAGGGPPKPVAPSAPHVERPVVPLKPSPPVAEIPKAPKVTGISGAKALGAAGDALLLGQMATAATPEETHAVLADAVFVPVQLALTYSPTALTYKYVFGFDPMKLQISLPALPWTERGADYYRFKAAAERHGQTLAP